MDRMIESFDSKLPLIVMDGAKRNSRFVQGRYGELTVWGRFEGIFEQELIAKIEAGVPVDQFMQHLTGFFAFVYVGENFSIAVVDRVASRPLVFGLSNSGVTLVGCRLTDFDNSRFAEEFRETDDDGAMQIALGGQTVGFRTIRKNLSFLTAGHALISSTQAKQEIMRYWRFEPWQYRSGDRKTLKAEAAEVLLDVLSSLDREAGARPIAIPLSAGLDSRAIASGLRKIGRDNVVCFSYGVEGNHEAVGAKKIARKLGYEWIFVPYTQRDSRNFFTGEQWKNYELFACHGAAIPFYSDLPGLEKLITASPGLQEAIFVNGQSGDFISGMHLPDALEPLANWPDIATAICDKHFSLWQKLKTRDRISAIDEELLKFLLSIDTPPCEPHIAGALYETSEFYDRQSKYVIGGQRQYELLGLEWDLPLWREPVVEFFGKLPPREKQGQALYSEMLYEENWGAVWRPLRHSKWVQPRKIRWMRRIAKVLCAAFGHAAWRRADQRLFAYWMDPLRIYAIEPYSRILLDTLGHRSSVSWISRRHVFDQAPNLAEKLFCATH